MVGVRSAALHRPGLLVAAVLAAVLVGGTPLLAQTAVGASPTPRCGGLLCDIGVLGGPVAGAPGSAPDATALPCRDFLCRAFGGGRDEAVAPPPPEQVAVEPTKSEKVRHAKAKPKVKTAKAEASKAEASKAEASKADALETRPAESKVGGAK